jgi:hypothetical protein
MMKNLTKTEEKKSRKKKNLNKTEGKAVEPKNHEGTAHTVVCP